LSIQKLFELSEVAEITGMTLGTVRQYVSNGVIPALYLGRKRVVQASVLEKICTEGLDTKKKEKAGLSSVRRLISQIDDNQLGGEGESRSHANRSS